MISDQNSVMAKFGGGKGEGAEELKLRKSFLFKPIDRQCKFV